MPLIFLSPTSEKFTVLFASLFPFAVFFPNLFLSASCCVVIMTQENTKLCDFSNTNNNDFIVTPLAPPATSAETCDINTALPNLIMKDQFSGTPKEDVASHLNTFMELCNIQKKKYVDNDVVKMKLFPFSLRDSAKFWFSSLPRNSINSWNKCKDAFIT